MKKQLLSVLVFLFSGCSNPEDEITVDEFLDIARAARERAWETGGPVNYPDQDFIVRGTLVKGHSGCGQGYFFLHSNVDSTWQYSMLRKISGSTITESMFDTTFFKSEFIGREVRARVQFYEGQYCLGASCECEPFVWVKSLELAR